MYQCYIEMLTSTLLQTPLWIKGGIQKHILPLIYNVGVTMYQCYIEMLTSTLLQTPLWIKGGIQKQSC